MKAISTKLQEVDEIGDVKSLRVLHTRTKAICGSCGGSKGKKFLCTKCAKWICQSCWVWYQVRFFKNGRLCPLCSVMVELKDNNWKVKQEMELKKK